MLWWVALLCCALPTSLSDALLVSCVDVAQGGGALEDIPLIPPLRGGDNEGWGLFPPLRSQQGAGGPPGTKSALLGDFNAPQEQQQPEQ